MAKQKEPLTPAECQEQLSAANRKLDEATDLMCAVLGVMREAKFLDATADRLEKALDDGLNALVGLREIVMGTHWMRDVFLTEEEEQDVGAPFTRGEPVLVPRYGEGVTFTVLGVVVGPGPLPSTTCVEIWPHQALYWHNKSIKRFHIGPEGDDDGAGE